MRVTCVYAGHKRTEDPSILDWAPPSREAPVTETNALTDHDHRIIAEAREPAGLRGTAGVQQRFSGWGGDLTASYVEAFGTAQWVLLELAGLAERLGG
jgi:hypothetical protein